MMQPKEKVVAYITRDKGGVTELLVFDHRDFPEAGTQVPAGTIELGENPEHALHREVSEESGLRDLRLVRFLGLVNDWRHNAHRHFYHLMVSVDLPDSWQWVTNDYHDEAHRIRNQPLVFCFRWLKLHNELRLAGNQHLLIPLVEPSICIRQATAL